ncbi:dymeclin-like isoform X1 [Micractinium conductrix]|uniref:Dymeclin n=1 Tax=Micractinium conductrix TaxID=554055 RepID=A0A2P6VKC4_9CHLO|nr:dymeclin-like isoform X1 [Micractinium conductrix]|eukprot:PSC74556.1 dymeclin-like isoform X1 [Micractinium conductrix]
MEQLNSEQLLSFVEVPEDVAAAAAEAVVAVAEEQAAEAALRGSGGGSGQASPGGSPTGSAAAVAVEFARLHNGSLVQTLVREAVLTLADDALLATGGYMLLLECSQLLLALGSSALYSPSARGQLGQHPFLDALMQQRDLANTAVEALLRLFIAAPVLPLSQKLYTYMPTDTRSMLRIVRTAAASVLWLPYQAYTLLLRPSRLSDSGEASGGTAGAPSNSPLGDSALLVLLVLLFHAPPQDAPFGNPYRQSLQRLQDRDDLVTADAAEGGRAAVAGDAAISYAALYEALGDALSSERAVLLLYALLHGCPHFHEYCLVRSDLDTLLLPLLELLYRAHERTPNQMYMLLIILLMLSQDAAFAQNIHRITLPSVPFYRERSARTALGSLLVVLLLRTAHYNLANLRDLYLHTNTLAALANLAPHMSGMSTHAAQRLVSLFHLLARRYSKLQAAAEGSGQPPTPSASMQLESPVTPWSAAPTPQQQAEGAAAGSAPGGLPVSRSAQDVAAQQQAGGQQAVAEGQAAALAGQAAAAAQAGPAGEAAELELQLYADFLRIVLEIINSILTSALPRNPELVYTLLHRQEVFAPFAKHPRYAELMENITRVTEFFNRRVEEAVAVGGGAQLSVERLLDIIKHHSRGWRRDRLKPFPELRFTYEEEASPEEFFVPYVWSLAVAQGGIPFTLSAITLFTPTVVPASESFGEESSPAPSPHPGLPGADGGTTGGDGGPAPASAV